ncbi:hypothetical protein Nepgr_007395 [Nepenthes gracilis]|uniref:60S ribosomal protein L18a-like protein n=1 Tax=Nepenthes gracilis TaxID=150966 RepID=A0AAD3S6Z6_NEPGR|nr:hypothetical protein Nepgr_007395 [Nepenthes gracilis]
MSEESKSRGFSSDRHHESHQPPPPPHPPQYGTFQGVQTYSPPSLPPHQQPAMGFPQPAPPPGAFEPPSAPPAPPPEYYSHGYQTVPGYAVAEGRPVRQRRLPCCGIGVGWFLFIIGFFLAAIPWYVGAIVLLCARNLDYREKPGYIGCTVAAILATVAIILGVTKGAGDW